LKIQAYLIHPVRVENPESTKLTSSSLLSDRSLVPLELELGDTLVLGLTIDNTLGHRPLPATTPDTDTVHNIPLKKKVNQKFFNQTNKASFSKSIILQLPLCSCSYFHEYIQFIIHPMEPIGSNLGA
jgi:hypothetical protein